jgi:putative hydrolase of the HAD superfamily
VIRAVLFDFGETLVERVTDDVHPLHHLSITAFSDAAPALESLDRAGYRLAVVSDTTQSTPANMMTVLDALGLGRYFDVVVTSFDVGREKPDRAMFDRALERLECAAHDAVMVGNDIVRDIGGAATLGMTTVLLARGGEATGSGPVVPTFTVRSLTEIPALVASVP